MDDIWKAREMAKEAMKQQLRSQVSSSWDRYWAEMQTTIQTAVDTVARQVLDEARIEDIAKTAKAGATYVAMQEVIRKTADDAIKQAQPVIAELAKALSDLMTGAANEAIIELLQERIQQALQSKLKQEGSP